MSSTKSPPNKSRLPTKSRNSPRSARRETGSASLWSRRNSTRHESVWRCVADSPRREWTSSSAPAAMTMRKSSDGGRIAATCGSCCSNRRNSWPIGSGLEISGRNFCRSEGRVESRVVLQARAAGEGGQPDEQALRCQRATRAGGSAWESNPARPFTRQRPILKTGRATGPRSLPFKV